MKRSHCWTTITTLPLHVCLMVIFWFFLQMKDFGFFMALLVIFVTGYGVAIQSLRNPNHPVSWTILRDVFYVPYWQIYAELFLEDFGGTKVANLNQMQSNCTGKVKEMFTRPRHLILPIIGWFMFFFLITDFTNSRTNVLLLNDFSFDCFGMDWFYCLQMYIGMRLFNVVVFGLYVCFTELGLLLLCMAVLFFNHLFC